MLAAIDNVVQRGHSESDGRHSFGSSPVFIRDWQDSSRWAAGRGLEEGSGGSVTLEDVSAAPSNHRVVNGIDDGCWGVARQIEALSVVGVQLVWCREKPSDAAGRGNSGGGRPTYVAPQVAVVGIDGPNWLSALSNDLASWSVGLHPSHQAVAQAARGLACASKAGSNLPCAASLANSSASQLPPPVGVPAAVLTSERTLRRAALLMPAVSAPYPMLGIAVA